MENTFFDCLNVDVLVVGGGYAGIKAAFECAKEGLEVAFVIREKLCSGGSFFPLCDGIGCLAPKDEKDKLLLLEELEQKAAGMNDHHLCEIYMDEIQDRIQELNDIGFDHMPLKGRNACFAESEHDLIIWYEFKKIKQNVREIFSKFPNVKVMEFCDVVQLIKKDNRILGAVVSDFQSRLIHIKTNNIIMATGGYGGLYEHSGTSSTDVCGLGQVMSLEAGAKLINLEFIQLGPALHSPVYRAPISEQTYQYCNGIFDENGNNILTRYLPKGISERECLDSRSTHGPFTSSDISKYFDISIMKEILKTENYDSCRLIYSKKIYEVDNPALNTFLSYLESIHINLLRDRITVIPIGHAANGGVWINENCETGVDGLYAAGELAGGLHGADRLGGLASGSCFVFGKRAANSVIRRYRSYSPVEYTTDKEALMQYESMLDSGFNSVLSPDEVMVEIKRLIWKCANVVRTEKLINDGLSILNTLDASYNAVNAIDNGETIRDAVRARHSLKMAKIFLMAIKERRESRGAHYREDYPELDNEHFNKRIAFSENDTKLKIEYI